MNAIMIGILIRMRHVMYVLLAVFLLLILPGQLQAQTPRIQSQGAAAAGMGNAFTGQANDPSAVH